MDYNPLLLRLEPLSTLFSGFKRDVSHSAELRNSLTKLVMEMGVQVVHDVMDDRV